MRLTLGLLALLLAACGEPQPASIEGADVVTEEGLDPVPEGELPPLAPGATYADLDELVLAAAPMAPETDVQTGEGEGDLVTIMIEASGFEDDSVRAQRFDVTARPGPDGLTVTALEEMYKCYRGGSDDWTSELCP